MSLEVIGAGFGRTGTLSLKAALERLGFGTCHHMEEVVRSPEQVRYWQSIADGEEADWDAVFEGFRSSCDWPSCTHWEALMRHFPDARIVLTVRDEDRWYDSAAETIHPATFMLPRWLQGLVPPLARANRMIIANVWDGEFDGRFEDREHAIRTYREHNAQVQAGVPPERLLVFRATDGWEPLCRFLDVPVPDEPYPHLNDAVRIRRMLRIARLAGWGLLFAVVLGVAAGIAQLL